MPEPKTSLFFRNLTPSLTLRHAETKQQPEYTDLGGNGDRMFRAVAAAIIDQALEHPTHYEKLIQNLLDQHKIDFPKPQHRERAPSSIFRLKQLMFDQPMAQFIRNLAFTLRQLTVDELLRDPTKKYRLAFTTPQTMISPAEMRRAETVLPETVLGALAHSLSLAIEVREIEDDKEIHKSNHYGNFDVQGKNHKLVLIAQDTYHFPEVANPSLFKSARAAIAMPPLPAVNRDDVDLEKIKNLIKESDQLLSKKFQENVKKLNAMRIAEDLDLPLLLKIYVSEMTSLYKCKDKRIGTEYGNQEFFKVIENTHPHLRISTKEKADFGSEVVKSLIEAISRNLSLGVWDEDKVFSYIEPEQQASSLAMR